jgi:hypothetical protein
MQNIKDDHPAHYIANEMAFAHNAMLRGLNAIYLQAPHVPAADAADFLFFVGAWCAWVLDHHVLEETRMFPGFAAVRGVRPGQLSHNVEQHHLFSGGLEALQAYAASAPAAEYDGAKLLGLVDGFAGHIRQHLADEIDTLWGLDCCEEGQEENLLEVYRDSEAEAAKQDKTVVPPMVLGLCDQTFQGGNNWPALPPGAADFIHNTLSQKNRGAWRFLPCDTFRNPRPLAFLGDDK